MNERTPVPQPEGQGRPADGAAAQVTPVGAPAPLPAPAPGEQPSLSPASRVEPGPEAPAPSTSPAPSAPPPGGAAPGGPGPAPAPAGAAAPAGAPPGPPAGGGPPGAPPFVPMPWYLAAGYISASLLIGLTQGVTQGFVATNINQIAGDLGATQTEATWLMAAFMIPRASMPLLLIKLRAQYGLRRFCEVAIVCYLVVALMSVFIRDLQSAVVAQFFAGMASAPLSTLAFLYILEPLPPALKMRVGLPIVMSVISVGPHFARVLSPGLMNDAGWNGLHLMTLGMAGIGLCLVYMLPLKSPPRVKSIVPMDIFVWLLIAVGFGGITIASVMGSIYWWTEVSWLGWTLAGAIACLAVAILIELHREVPLMDIRWLVSPAMLHLTIALLVFRLILSDQSAGAPRMFQQLGIIQDQLVGLFAVISAATLLGGLVLPPFLRLDRVPQIHVIALILIAIGAYMDSHSTIDTRPHQMMFSQAMIAFAGSLFMGPAMLRGLMAALARGPNYLLSFVIVFLSTQSLGGVVGSGIFSTIIYHQQVLHSQVLREQLTAPDPIVTQAISQRVAIVAPQFPDLPTQRSQATQMLAQDVTNQSYVLAYNDIYLLTSLLALGALCVLLLHIFRDWLVARWPDRAPHKGSVDPEVTPRSPAPEPAR